MATTTTNNPTASQPVPYIEHDKLGPLGDKPPVLDDPAQLRRTLIEEFHAAVQAARDAIGTVTQAPETAVHESRKALRRARAVLAMMAPALPKSEHRAIRDALQEARRALSTARDQAVAPETLSGIHLTEPDRDIAKRVLDNAGRAMPPVAELRQLLGESAARAAAQAEALEAALPAEVDCDTVAEGIRATYRAARRAYRGSKRSKRQFHRWRRRSKELGYQLELIARHAGPRIAAIHAEIDGIADTLSPAVDMIMVRDFIRAHTQAIPDQASAQLVAAIGGQIDDLMKIGRKAGHDMFRQRPRKFEKRLSKAVERDLAPADEQDPVESVAD